jgi:hypothetical protein
MDKELKEKATEAYLIQQVSTAMNNTMVKTLLMHLCLYDKYFANNAEEYLQNVREGTVKLLEKSPDKKAVEVMTMVVDDIMEEYAAIVKGAEAVRKDIANRVQ